MMLVRRQKTIPVPLPFGSCDLSHLASTCLRSTFSPNHPLNCQLDLARVQIRDTRDGIEKRALGITKLIANGIQICKD
jgi:hypothetical protein